MNLDHWILRCGQVPKELCDKNVNYKWINETLPFLIELQIRRKLEVRPKILAVVQELDRAMSIHDPMNSAHEGYAIILEELDELWKEIKKKEHKRDIEHMKEEAIQLSAMGLRFVIDVCGGIKKMR